MSIILNNIRIIQRSIYSIESVAPPPPGVEITGGNETQLIPFLFSGPPDVFTSIYITQLVPFAFSGPSNVFSSTVDTTVVSTEFTDGDVTLITSTALIDVPISFA